MLTRLRQIAAKVESVEGTAVALAAADAANLHWNPKQDVDVSMFVREPARRSLSKVGKVSGIKMSSISFGLTLRGPGTATTSPEWSKYLRACGFTESELESHTVGAITGGPFVHGEVITQATSSASGVVVLDTATGTTVLYYVDLGTGTWDTTNVVTGGTSGATVTPSANNGAVGRVWQPFSHELSSVDIGSISNGPFGVGEIITGGTSGAKGVVFESTADGASRIRFKPITSVAFQNAETVTGEGSTPASCTSSSAQTQAEVPSLSVSNYEDGRVKSAKGARGSVKFAGKVGEPMMVEFTFSGVLNGDIADTPLLSGISHFATIPPVILDASLSYGGVAVVASEVGLDLGNTLSPRADFNDPSGNKSVRISARDWTGTIDPESVLVAQDDVFGDWFDNALKVLKFTVGSTSGNKYLFYSKRAQTSKIDDGDREGIALDSSTYDLVGDVNDGDNELALLQL